MARVSFIALIIFCICIAQVANGQKRKNSSADAACREAKQKAIKDYKAKKLKYYAFGIVAPSKRFIDSMKQYNVTTVSRGCVVNESQMCYNEAVDSILAAKLKKR